MSLLQTIIYMLTTPTHFCEEFHPENDYLYRVYFYNVITERDIFKGHTPVTSPTSKLSRKLFLRNTPWMLMSKYINQNLFSKLFCKRDIRDICPSPQNVYIWQFHIHFRLHQKFFCGTWGHMYLKNSARGQIMSLNWSKGHRKGHIRRAKPHPLSLHKLAFRSNPKAKSNYVKNLTSLHAS